MYISAGYTLLNIDKTNWDAGSQQKIHLAKQKLLRLHFFRDMQDIADAGILRKSNNLTGYGVFSHT